MVVKKTKTKKRRKRPYSQLSYKKISIFLRKRGGKPLLSSVLKYLRALGHTRVLFPPRVAKGVQYRLVCEFLSTKPNYVFEFKPTLNFGYKAVPSFRVKRNFKMAFEKFFSGAFNKIDVSDELFEEYKKIEGITPKDTERLKLVSANYRLMLLIPRIYQGFYTFNFLESKARLSISLKSRNSLFRDGI